MPTTALQLTIGPLTFSVVSGALHVRLEGVTRPLPCATVAAVFARYGHALDDEVAVEGDQLVLGDGARLATVAHRAPVDVIANDHAVYLAGDGRRLAVPAPLFVGALAALVGAAARSEK